MQALLQDASRVMGLIDAASARVGSAYKLAKVIGYTNAEVSMWRLGRRSCPIEAQVLMAPVAGLDVDAVIREALIERNANTPRGEKLISALGKGLMAAGVLIVSTAFDNDALASSVPVALHLLRCILC